MNSALAWHKVFSGWLFKNAPSVNVVEHPVYDVWVKACEMSFPGEETPAPEQQREALGAARPAPHLDRRRPRRPRPAPAAPAA